MTPLRKSTTGSTPPQASKLSESEWADLVISRSASMKCSVAEVIERAGASTAGIRDTDVADKLTRAQIAHTGQSYRDAFVQLFGTRYPL
jgi:hypothetical protein